MFCLRDTAAQLTVLTDVAQELKLGEGQGAVFRFIPKSKAGTGCIRDGEIELMVHRRLLKEL